VHRSGSSPEASALPVLWNCELLLENWRSSAGPLPFQRDIYFDTVGDLDEGNVPVPAVGFDECPIDVVLCDCFHRALPIEDSQSQQETTRVNSASAIPRQSLPIALNRCILPVGRDGFARDVESSLSIY
jgi:hypothetical protein